MQKKYLRDISLEDYILGVYPVSLRCQRQYKTKFHLYFQKNLQIISRFQTPNQHIRKQQVALFNVPDQIQPFRVHSDKIMDYKWSLYIKKNDISGKNQEFVENCPIDLHQEWQYFKDVRQPRVKKVVQLPKMKIKFTFIIIFASNHKELLQYTTQYFGKEEKETSPESTKTKNLSQNIIPQPKPKEYIQTKNNSPLSSPKSQNKAEIISHFTIEIPTFVPAINEARKSQINSPEQPRLQLTGSQKQLGNQIEQKINNLHTDGLNNGRIQIAEIKQEKLTVEKSQTLTRVTTSQLLNSKGIPLPSPQPFYKKKNFIKILLVLTFFSVVFCFMGLSTNVRKKSKKYKERANNQRQKWKDIKNRKKAK